MPWGHPPIAFQTISWNRIDDNRLRLRVSPWLPIQAGHQVYDRALLSASCKPAIRFLRRMENADQQNLACRKIVKDQMRKTNDRPIPQAVLKSGSSFGMVNQIKYRFFDLTCEIESKYPTTAFVPVGTIENVQIEIGMIPGCSSHCAKLQCDSIPDREPCRA